jgi:hypothetical protein
VNEQEIDLFHCKPREAALCGDQQIVFRDVVGPDLGRYEQILARHAAAADAFTDLNFIAMHGRCIDVPIARLDRRAHSCAADIFAQLERAEATRRNARAIAVHEESLGHVRSLSSSSLRAQQSNPAWRAKMDCQSLRSSQ